MLHFGCMSHVTSLAVCPSRALQISTYKSPHCLTQSLQVMNSNYMRYTLKFYIFAACQVFQYGLILRV